MLSREISIRMKVEGQLRTRLGGFYHRRTR